MVSKIYTKTGDDGTTGLVNGKRVSKSNLRLVTYGTLDELNSHMGVLIAHIEQTFSKECDEDIAAELNLLEQIQHALFSLGALLACENESRSKFKLEPFNKDLEKIIEDEIDKLDTFLPPLKNFILPGGTICASYCHVCRTVTRRAERRLILFKESLGPQGLLEVPSEFLLFCNRLSDYFFTLSRFLNFKGGYGDVFWKRDFKIY